MNLSDLCFKHPKLFHVIELVKQLKPSPGFCMNDKWFGYRNNGQGIHHELCMVLGIETKNYSEDDYHAAYDLLFAMMPGCQHDPKSTCTGVN